MDGYLSIKLENFVDDPEKFYRLRRHEAQAKKLKLQIQKRRPKDRQNLQRNHHLQALGRINFNRNRWENNRSRSASSGSFAPQILSTYQS
jgi:hypothetical protein